MPADSYHELILSNLHLFHFFFFKREVRTLNLYVKKSSKYFFKHKAKENTSVGHQFAISELKENQWQISLLKGNPQPREWAQLGLVGRIEAKKQCPDFQQATS